MASFLKDPVHRGWAFTAIVLVLAVTLLAPLVVNAEGRHLTGFRDGPRDASGFREALDGKAARVEAYLSTPHQLADIREPQRALLVILGSERRYSEGETAAVLDFLDRGGNVILADEGGYGTDIAREVGFAFIGSTLLDTQNHLNDPTLVRATGKLDGRDHRLLFNAPTALTVLPSAGAYTVLAQSSSAVYPDGSYLDTNDNDEIDIGDAAGPFPLIVRTAYGAGTLILVADTGVFMNEQVRLLDYDNDEFASALAGSLIPRDGIVILDEARHAPTAGVAAYDGAVRTLGRLTSGLVAPLLTLLVLLIASAAAWSFTRETEDWSHHAHNLGVEVPVPAEVRPDLDRARRMASRRISERFNIPLEQVAAMTGEDLLRLTGDKLLSDAAAGTLRSDPAPLFSSLSTPQGGI